jgi:hypothetical protein
MTTPLSPHHLSPVANCKRLSTLGPLALLAAVVGFSFQALPAAAFDARGGQFIALNSLSKFEKSPGTRGRETVYTSPVIEAQLKFNELVPSWNAEMPDGTYMKVEARALYPETATKYFTMGLWSSNPGRFPRASVAHQKDDDGDVNTDTLILTRPAARFQLRITLGTAEPEWPKVKFLGVCLNDTTLELAPLSPNRAAWDRTLPVPERCQMDYTNGSVLCSATTTSMLLSFWAEKLHRKELNHDVPDVVKAIYDSQWKGTGNWPFNTAYAGSFRGMRAYVTRLSDLAEVEDWIAAGIPVGLSVCSDRLHHRGPGPNGHLIVCAGFTENGDVVVNDPSRHGMVRRVYPRKDVIYAWSYSNNAVYLVYPENSEVPKDRFGHWASWTARQRIVLE